MAETTQRAGRRGSLARLRYLIRDITEGVESGEYLIGHATVCAMDLDVRECLSLVKEKMEEMNRTLEDMQKETTEQPRMDKEDDIKTLDETHLDRPLNSFVRTDRQEDYVVALLRLSLAEVEDL